VRHLSCFPSNFDRPLLGDVPHLDLPSPPDVGKVRTKDHRSAGRLDRLPPNPGGVLGGHPHRQHRQLYRTQTHPPDACPPVVCLLVDHRLWVRHIFPPNPLTGLIFHSNRVEALYVARFVAGLAIGGVSVAAPMYVAELAHTSIRGTLGTFFQVQITVGVLLEYLLGKEAESYAEMAPRLPDGATCAENRSHWNFPDLFKKRTSCVVL
jgi:hypothetical protein